jgi:very-short-patch-repair endonuclease
MKYMDENFKIKTSETDNNPNEKIVEIDYQPYVKKPYFFSVAELKFYELLKEIIGDNYYIYPKVRICDIIKPENKGNYSDFNRIKSKHVDFLLCTKNPITSKIIIELDDSTHNYQSRQDRDNFVDEIFANSGIPIVHIRVQYKYNKGEITNQLKEAYKIKYSVKEKSDSSFTKLNRGCGNLFLLFIIIFLGILLK